MSVALSYNLLVKNLDRSLSLAAAQGPVKLETKYYKENIGKVGSIDDFLKDTRLFKYAMTAFGLEEFSNAKGYMRKILESALDDPKSLVSRTNDPKIKEFAKVFDFKAFGKATTQRAATGQAVVDRYVRQTMETDAGEQDGDGVRLALYFKRMASQIATPYDILADQALSKVVRVALGMPNEMAAASIEKQAAAIEKRIELEDFQDPAKVDKFLTRFTAMWDATEETTSNPVLALFDVGSSSSSGVSLDLAMSLSSFRLGGR